MCLRESFKLVKKTSKADTPFHAKVCCLWSPRGTVRPFIFKSHICTHTHTHAHTLKCNLSSSKKWKTVPILLCFWNCASQGFSRLQSFMYNLHATPFINWVTNKAFCVGRAFVSHLLGKEQRNRELRTNTGCAEDRLEGEACFSAKFEFSIHCFSNSFILNGEKQT